MKEGKQESEIRKRVVELGSAYIHNLSYCVKKYFNQKYLENAKNKDVRRK